MGGRWLCCMSRPVPKLAAAGRALKEKTTGGVIGVARDDEESSGEDGEE